jgi:hypothetical protein
MAKQFRDFESAREFVRSLGLQSTKEWRAYTKSGNKPDDIPNSPDFTYKKNFKGYGDWLGTGRVATNGRVYLPFKEAREFVRELNLKNIDEWRAYTKSGNKPDDIPSAPHNIYKKEWKGVGDWLGTGSVSSKDRYFRSFTEAREFVRALNLKSDKEWKDYCKSGNKPDDIPFAPRHTYKNEFKGMGDFLGTGTVASFNREYRSFKEAREFVRSLGLKNQNEWKDYCKSGNKPDNIPRNANTTYKNEFKGMGDWLGTDSISNRDKVFRSFTEAREFVRALNLSGEDQWREYCTSGNKPDDIPSNPNTVYKNNGYLNSGDWLGTGYIALSKRKYRSFTEAREFVRKLGLKNANEWKEYCKSGNKPDDIPSTPWVVYNEWSKK